jgi:hypothetical protein
MKPGPYLIWGLIGAAAIVVAAMFVSQATSATTEPFIDGSRIRTSAILGEREHTNSFESFAGGELHTVMGSMELDFRGSSMGGDQAEIEVFLMMGGIDLRVPEDWVIVNELNLIMGGIEDKTETPAGANAGRLVLRGTVLMGGLNVRN